MLYDTLNNKCFELGIGKNDIEDVSYITENLRYSFFDWQREALENFLKNEKVREKENSCTPNHLMFNMATGTGKTMMMAALILYYYKHGYRNFIFFVNQRNIVGKTQENFLNQNHPKYLFKQYIVIDGKHVKIREVEKFSTGSCDIQIKFTTIHKLHNAIYDENENNVLLSDLHKRDIIFIADEAHHLNTRTNGQETLLHTFSEKEMGKPENVEKCWENSTKILFEKRHKDGSRNNSTANKNVLLEFTATIPENDAVKRKYEDKIIFKFELKEFVKAGYTKDINLISSNFEKKGRILLALAFNWYRATIAEKNGIQSFKPVILFRSKTIEDSKNDHEEFLEHVRNIRKKDFNFLKDQRTNQETPENSTEYYKSRATINQLKRFINENFDEHCAELCSYIQSNFNEHSSVITNSETKKKEEVLDEDLEFLLNSLEAPRNPIRAIFTVQRLTEGWDVQNLFDIVRLYSGRDAYKKGGQRVAGTSTTSEVQLIGRGVRFYPYVFNDQKVVKRKYDGDLTNELRILEEFYYHCDDDSRYIQELIEELKNKQLLNDGRKRKEFKVKDSVKNSLANTFIFVNHQQVNPNRKRKSIPRETADLLISSYNAPTESIIFQNIDIVEGNSEIVYQTEDTNRWTHQIAFKDFYFSSRHIVYKAVHKLNVRTDSFYRLENLKKLYEIDGLEDFFKLIGNLQFNIICKERNIQEVSSKAKLNAVLLFFEKLALKLRKFDHPKIGTRFEKADFQSVFGSVKEKLIDETKSGASENKTMESSLNQKDWYVIDGFWGTDQERNFIRFFEEHLGNLEEKFENIRLVRNEEVYKIYSFDEGQAFDPDFLLLMNRKGESEEKKCYQVFIEPKGKPLLENDRWKENFLLDITKQYGYLNPEIVWGENYFLIGLPFFNSEVAEQNQKFENDFDVLQKVD